MSGRLSRRPGPLRSAALVAAAVTVSSTVLAACGGAASGGPTTVNFYINPDSSGSTQKAADECSAESGGRYRIAISVLPATADGQREQIVRRLAAKDSDIDLAAVDPPLRPNLSRDRYFDLSH